LLRPDRNEARDEDHKSFLLNVDKDRFVNAREFNLNQWPDYNESAWGPRVYSYYGLDSKDAGFSRGAAGSSAEMSRGRGSSYSYYPEGMNHHGPTRADGTPIDNGTAPDGKGTFIRGPRYY
jgi:hypothetical protein